jgi:signal transduction histidine kinase
MRDGGILTVGASEVEGNVWLDISDSGEGIPENMQIFEPFVTNKPHTVQVWAWRLSNGSSWLTVAR